MYLSIEFHINIQDIKKVKKENTFKDKTFYPSI